MADASVKADSGNDLVLKNDSGTSVAKIIASGTELEVVDALKINGSTSGGVSLKTGAVVTDYDLTLPTSSGAGVIKSDSSGVITFGGGAIQFAHENIGRGTVSYAAFPNDDTVPQDSEGSTIFTSAAFTPLSSTSKIVVECIVRVGESANSADAIGLALFSSASTSAIQVTSNYVFGSTTAAPHGGAPLTIKAIISSWGLTSRTFELRVSETTAYNYQHNGGGLAEAIYSLAASETPFIITEYEQ